MHVDGGEVTESTHVWSTVTKTVHWGQETRSVGGRNVARSVGDWADIGGHHGEAGWDGVQQDQTAQGWWISWSG